MNIKELLSTQRFFFFCLAAWNSLIALPSEGVVIRGHATLISSSEALQINANGKAILNWEQFNIAPHEAVSFVQSQKSQAILNRVVSSSPSGILGSLQANCPIYLVNPNGVFIGSSACIETAGFLASTADLSNEAFLQGTELLFQEFGPGSIVNLGKIHAGQGDVYLIARAGVDNQSSIEAPNGIAMLTTCEMMLNPDTKECVFIRVSDAAEEGIQNSGTIQALAVELHTQSPYEKAIQHSGSIEALSALEQNGRIYLVAERSVAIVNGSLLAESGEIRVLGQTVILEDGAVIDASGEFGGGTVLIGGDYQGVNPEVLNAQETFVAKDASIRADAVLDGNGGKVILWANEKTNFLGKVSAEGGKNGGNGGFVEISAKSNDWRYGGVVSTQAPSGKSGTLLLDPSNITISAGAIGGSSPAFVNPYNPVVASATLTNGDLQNALTSSNVTVATSAGSGGAGAVTFAANVTWAADTRLTVNANQTILVNGGITVSNTFMGTPTNNPLINFTANTGTPIAGNFDGMRINGTVSTINGDISCAGRSGTTNDNQGMRLAGQVSSSGNGSISLIGTASASASNNGHEGIYMTGSFLVNVQNGDLYIQGTAGPGTSSQGIQMDTTATVRSQGTGNIVIVGTGLNTAGTDKAGLVLGDSAVIESLGSGNIDITATGAGAGVQSHGLFLTTTTNRISSTSGNITIQAQGAVAASGNANGLVLAGQITTQDGAIDITANGGGNGATGVGLDLTTSSSKISSTSGDITIQAQGGPNATTNSHGVRLISGQITTQSGTIDITATGGGATGTGGAPGFGMANATARVQATTTGSIIIRGTGGGNASTNVANYGMSIQAGGQVLTNTGSLTCECSGGSLGTNAWGVNITALNSKIGSTGGLVTITGTGGGAAASNHGIFVTTSGQITNTSGNIVLDGTAAPLGTGSTSGILVTGTTSAVTTTSGNIDITAQGNGSGSGNNGLSVTAAGVISTTSGTITVNATASTTAAGNTSPGIFIDGANSRITTVTGAIDLTGTGGAISTSSSQGIRITTAGGITTTGMATSITLHGISTAPNEGILISGTSSTISSSTGTISLTGTPVGTANGISVSTGASVVTNISGTITASSNNRLSIGNNGSIRTLGTGGGGLNDITVDTVGVSLIAGTSGQALMSTVNGNIAITSEDTVLLTASTVAGSLAQITVGNLANTITLRSVGLTLTGGLAAAASGAFAEISTVGGLISIDGTTMSSGAISLTGGTSTNTYAQIITRTNALTTAANAIEIGQTPGQSHPTDLTLQGGNATAINAICRASIASDAGGNIASNITGNYSITGGTGSVATVNSNAGFYSGLSSGSGNVTLVGNGYSITGGASGAGLNYARISAPSGGGSINLTSNSGAMALQGGGGSNAAAQILTNGIGSIAIIGNGAISLLGSTVAGGINALASISTTNGNIGLSTSGLLTLTGGTQAAGTYAQITPGNVANMVAIQSAGITMTGGGTTASGAFAEISALGGLITIDGAGPISLTGGSNATSPAQIINRTNIPVGDAISIGFTTPATTLALQGGLASDGAPAYIVSDMGGNIVCNTSGDWTITGGSSGSDATAGIITGFNSGSGNIITTSAGAISITGGSGTGTNYAGLFTGLVGGSGDISIDATSISLTGGSNTGTNYAQIATPAGGGAITLTAAGGPSILQGGAGNVSNAQIITNGTGNINFTGAGNFSVLGGSGDSSFAAVTATNAVNITGNNYTLTGGASGMADGSNAVIESTGMNGSVTLVGSDITLNGGTAANQHSYIQTTAGSGTNPIAIACGALHLNGSGVSNGSAEIQTVLGNIGIAASGNITLTAGTASQAAALIQSTSQGALTLAAQNFLVQAGSTAGSSGVITQSGDISIACTQNVSLSATVPNASAIVQTLGSDLTMSVGGSINLVGASISTPAPVGHLLLIAGVDISIDGTTEVTALGTMASSLTLVVDNNFPTPSGMGPGAFILNAGGILSTEAGMPLKIYTAARDQNTVNGPINGVLFVPGTLGVATSTEEWNVYYPEGSYEGAAFKFYYKTPALEPGLFFELIAANLVELAYLLPVLDVNRKRYHFNLTFSPYGSFIFEDDVYWTGEKF